MASRTAPSQIRAIAIAQKHLLWVICATLSLIALRLIRPEQLLERLDFDPRFAELLLPVFVVLNVALLLAQLISVIRLSRAVGEGWTTVFYALAMVVPCVSLLCLLTLNSRATSRLRKVGISVGLLGARWEDVDAYRVDIHSLYCPACGEPIEGSIQSCPMCGASIGAPQPVDIAAFLSGLAEPRNSP